MTDNRINEELRADELTADEAIELVLKRPGMYGLTRTDEFRKVEAERDAALAAIERVRAIHYETEGVHCHTVCAHRYCKDDSGDQHRWPCPTVAALDGAPDV